jgi:hypothetical protein
MEFSKYAYVVLNDPGELERDLAQALCGYVSRGGAVLIAVGENTVLAGRVPLSSDHIGGTHQLQGAGFVDAQHAAMMGTGHFENVEFSEAAWITPKPTARVVARLSNGSPLLLEERMGEGRALIFASTLDNSTSDFPLHSSFVAFVVQSGHYLAGLEDISASATVGTPVTLRHTKDQTTAADLIGPDGKHELSLTEATKAMTADLAQNGVYDVQRADGRRFLLAVHADRRESDLTTAPKENLDLWRNTGVTDAGNKNAEVARTTGERQTRPWSLWRFALGLVLVAAVVEWVFASRYLREERQTA